MHPAPRSAAHRRLAALFALWKAVLVVVALVSPGPGYDTSTHILLQQSQARSGSGIERLVVKLTRWDAIYFTISSLRGHHLHEQEWAFSPLLPTLSASLSTRFPFTHIRAGLIRHAAAGIALSHLSHFLAVLVLFHLTYDLIPAGHQRKHHIALTTACLHILSPAGLFLSAAYAESFFALANFAGLFCYVASRRQHTRGPGWKSAFVAACWTIASGVLLGTATMARGNGLLNGIIFAWDALLSLPRLSVILQQRSWVDLIKYAPVFLGGSAIAAGYVIPQFEAYRAYCTNGNTRPWCSHLPPSVYVFVQSHYWHVGFLRYWTAGNVPLFALATPMLLVLSSTAWTALDPRQLEQITHAIRTSTDRTDGGARAAVDVQVETFTHYMARFALPQLLLSVLALTSFHVQIINRISSGYPVWYVLLACAIHTPELATEASSTTARLLARYSKWLVRASVMYALVQAGLFASFMPPA